MHPNATAAVPLAPTSDGVKRFMSALAYGASDRNIKMTTATKAETSPSSSSTTTPEPTTPTVTAAASVARSTPSSSIKSAKTKVALRRLAESLAYGASDRHIKLSPAEALAEDDEAADANGGSETPSVSDASEASAAKQERFDRLMASLAYGASDRHIRPIR